MIKNAKIPLYGTPFFLEYFYNFIIQIIIKNPITTITYTEFLCHTTQNYNFIVVFHSEFKSKIRVNGTDQIFSF